MILKKTKLVILAIILSFILSGCANLAGLVSLGAAGYGIYQAVKGD